MDVKRIAVVGALLLAGCTAKPAAAPPQVLAADVAYPSGKETVRGYLCRPLGGGPRPALVVIHGDRGLDAATKRHARRLAGLGYVALAVDLYRGERADDVLDAHIMDRGLPDEQVFRDLKSAVGYLTSRSDVRAGAVGVVGHHMGGGYALDAPVRDPRLKAGVTCYGRLTTDPQWLRPLQAPVLGIFAGNDEGITPQTIE